MGQGPPIEGGHHRVGQRVQLVPVLGGHEVTPPGVQTPTSHRDTTWSAQRSQTCTRRSSRHESGQTPSIRACRANSPERGALSWSPPKAAASWLSAPVGGRGAWRRSRCPDTAACSRVMQAELVAFPDVLVMGKLSSPRRTAAQLIRQDPRAHVSATLPPSRDLAPPVRRTACRGRRAVRLARIRETVPHGER